MVRRGNTGIVFDPFALVGIGQQVDFEVYADVARRLLKKK
jgi:hypothetical protein